VKAGFWDYVKGAFNARPKGMFIPPNWIGVGALGLLGLINPGFWLLGAGLELGYLYVIGTNPRFQRTVEATMATGEQKQGQDRMEALVSDLATDDQRRYRSLERRCHAIVEHLRKFDRSPELAAQGEGLGRLLYIYLRLLLTRQAINQVLSDAARADTEVLDDRVQKLDKQIKDEASEDLRKSLQSQLEILQQRQVGRKEAKEKLRFLDAELTRIEEQAELLREQAVLATDPSAVSQRIDAISATLGGTTQWIKEQQQMYGKVDDLLAEPPPIVTPQGAKEAQ